MIRNSSNKKNKFLFLFAFAIFLFSQVNAASAADYYVSKSGSNSNDGQTLATAWQTPAYAAQQANTGDTVYVVKGEWNNEYIQFANSGTPSQWITFTTYNGTVKLTGSGSDSAFYGNAISYIRLTGDFEIDNYFEGLKFLKSNNINISGITVKNSVDDGISISRSSSYMTIDQIKVINTRQHGILIWGGGGQDSYDNKLNHHITIRNSTIDIAHHNGIDIHTNAEDILVENNKFYNITNRAAVLSHNFRNKRITIRNNYMEHNERGIWVTGTNDSIIENNTIIDSYTDNGILVYRREGSPGSSTPITQLTAYPGVHNVTFKDNYIRNSRKADIGLSVATAADDSDTISNVYFINNSINKDINLNAQLQDIRDITFKDLPDTDTRFTLNNNFQNISVEFTDNKVFSENSVNSPLWNPDKSYILISGSTTISTYPMTATPTTASATLTVNKFDTSLVKGNILVEFTTDTINSNTVTFTITTLKPGTPYLIKKGGNDFTMSISDPSGKITFTNSLWPAGAFTIEEGDFNFQKIDMYDPFEVSLTSTTNHTNPFTEVMLNATFTGPTKTIKIDGFWDGDQNYKIRMAPTEAGIWNYTTGSNDEQLNAITGTFYVTDTGKKGFVKVNPAYPHTFMYDDGTPFFWLADTNRDWASLSTSFNDGTFQNYIDTRASQGFTLIQGTLEHSYSGAPGYKGENEGGYAFTSLSGEVINPSYYEWLDKRVEYIMSKDLPVAFWFIWSDDWNSRGLNGDKYKRYAKYLVSRYSAYNVLWGVTGAYEEVGNDAGIRDAGQYIQSINPYNHPVTTHTTGITSDSFGNEAWIDFHGQQRKALSLDNFNSLIISDRAYNKPVVNMEQCYEAQTGYGCIDVNEYRKAGWSILTGGGFFTYGHNNIISETGSRNWNNLNSPGAKEMTHIRNFFDKIEWWKMSPDNSLVTSGYALANPGKEYVIYLPDGGTTEIDLKTTSGVFTVRAYNPRDGTYTVPMTQYGGSSAKLSFSDKINDIVIYLNKTSELDKTRPEILSVSMINDTEVSVMFSKLVEQSSATALSNYEIDNGITITSATLGTDLKTVTLATTPHTEGIDYTLTITNVKDKTIEPNTILPGSTAKYQYTKESIFSKILKYMNII